MRNGWILLAVPGTSVLLAAVLYLSATVEHHMLSPRTLIRGVVRARRSSPEFAEAFVARQFERLLRDASAAVVPAPAPRSSGAAQRRSA